MLINFETIVRKYGKPKGILHVGANTGQEAEAYEKSGVNNVVWIEALPHVYDKLLQHVSKFNHISINACVSNSDIEIVTFHESNNEAQSSSFLELGTHKQAHPDVHYIKSYQMITTRLDTLLNNAEIIDIGNKLDMLVMDIQGAEMLALEGLGDRINQFNKIYLEVNTKEVYEGCALFPEIVAYLNKKGFYKRDLKIFDHWGWGDCLFTR